MSRVDRVELELVELRELSSICASFELLGRRLTSFDRPGTSMGFQGRLLKLIVGLGLHLELCFSFSSFRENSSLSTSLAIQLKPFRAKRAELPPPSLVIESHVQELLTKHADC